MEPVMPLPNEVLSLVADGLRQPDLYHCQLVCRDWHTVFRLALYRSLDTDLDPSSLARASIPFHYVRHLQWQPRSSCSYGGKDVICLLEKTRLLQSLHVPYPTVFRHLDVTSGILLRLQELRLEEIPEFSVIIPLLSSLRMLRRLSLSSQSPPRGDLALADLDAIVRHAPELSELALRSHILQCTDPGIPLAPLSLHRKLRSLRIAFHWAVDGDDNSSSSSSSSSSSTSAGGAARWLFYLSRAFPGLQHLTLSGHSINSHGSHPLPRSDSSAMPSADTDSLFLACAAVGRLPALTDVRLIHLHDFIHPDLYPLLVRHKQRVQLVGATGSKNDSAWLARTISGLQAHTTDLCMTLVYPRALCSRLLQHLPLTSLSLGRTAGFCSSRGHWQVPLNEIFTYAPHLVHLAFYQVTLSFHASSVPVATHGLRRLRFQHVVLTSSILELCGRRCPSLHTLEMASCKWMDPLEQAGRIPFRSDHRFRLVDIQDSGHLYNLKAYQLLTIHDQWILVPKHSAMGSSIKYQQVTLPDDFGERSQPQTWRTRPSQWSHVDPAVALSHDVAGHGYLAIQCHSVDALYFNGSSRITLAPSSSLSLSFKHTPS